MISADQSQLMIRMIRLRRLVRRRLVIYGFYAVFAGGILSFLAIATLDWLTWLPPLLRMGVALLFFAGMITSTMHWIVKPLRAKITLDEIAGKLEQHFSGLQDRLSSAVCFIQRGDPGSENLMRKVIDNAEKTVIDLPLESALSLKPMFKQSMWFSASVIALVTIMVVSPGWTQIGFYRYLHPFGSIAWPRTVSIIPLTGDITAAIGDSITVRMEVERGWKDTLRGVVRIKELSGSIHTMTLHNNREGIFYTTIDSITRDMSYWFEAGDDDTKDHLYHIRVIKRPEVVEALVEIEPPPYAVDYSVYTRDLRDQPVSAPIGGYVNIMIRANKPMMTKSDSLKQPGLRMEQGELIPLHIDSKNTYALSSRIEIKKDLRFRVELWDHDGFENRGSNQFTIRAIPDRSPIVSIVKPQSTIELTPMGSFKLLVRVTDDFGIKHLDLKVNHLSGEEVFNDAFTDQLETVNEEHGLEAIAEYHLDVEPMTLRPGDVLVYTVFATDNHMDSDLQGQVGQSSAMRIKIISQAEFDARIRGDLALLETRIRKATLDQAEIMDRTQALIQQNEDTSDQNSIDRESAAKLGADENRLIRRVQDLSNRFVKLMDRMLQNKAGDEESKQRITMLGKELRNTADGPMADSSGLLRKVSRENQPAKRLVQMDKAVHAEEVALKKLRALSRSMSQWGYFQSLIARTQDLLNRQENIRSQTIETGKALIGKPIESLSNQEQASLNRLKRRQEQLAEDVEQTIQRMQEMLATLSEKDPAGAASVEDAIRAARAHHITRRAKAASNAIGANRTSAATVEQKATSAAIRKMVSALKKRQDRELEEIRKRLDQASDQVVQLLNTQKSIRTSTQDAGMKEDSKSLFINLSREQRTLQRNTRFLGEELTEVQKTIAVGRLVRQAATPMRLAMMNLRLSQSQATASEQDQAIDLLNQALVQLKALSEQTADEELRRNLAQIREDLENIRDAQKTVNASIVDIMQAVDTQGRVTRQQARQASKLARQQSDVRELVEALLNEFDKVVVYKWAMERVSKWMEQTQSALYDRKIDEKLLYISKRIVKELDKLIGAIIETESLPVDTDFVEADSGGSGQGQQGNSKPIPTIAELLVLKAMQQDVNQRTKEINENFELETATEEQLQNIHTIGEDQAEVSRLTKKVTQRARKQ